jgi:hypothetical protein
MRAIFLILALLGVAACADTHAINRTNQISKKLTPSATGYVSVPTDGRYGTAVYAGSGLMSTQIVAAAFARHLQRVEQAAAPQEFEVSLDTAKKKGATYLIAPAILHWEDRATEWSGIPDKVELQIKVIEVATGQTIEQAIVSGRSGWATLGGDHPQDLLPKPVQEYVQGLF